MRCTQRYAKVRSHKCEFGGSGGNREDIWGFDRSAMACYGCHMLIIGARDVWRTYNQTYIGVHRNIWSIRRIYRVYAGVYRVYAGVYRVYAEVRRGTQRYAAVGWVCVPGKQ
jgi:hypothetical protein